jgi:outer membrane lipoprotein-sorting protein
VPYLLFFLLLAPDRRDFLPELEQLVQQMDQTHQKVESLQARFTQTKTMKLLAEPMVSTGTFYLKKTQGMFFQFDPPSQVQLFFLPGEVISINHEDQTANRKKLPKRKTDLTQLLVSEKISKILSYFDMLSITPEASGDTVLVMEPRRRKLKRSLSQVTLGLDGEGFLQKIHVTDAEGDCIEVVFSQRVLNPELDDSLFHVDIPKEYRVGKAFDAFLAQPIEP